MRLRVLKALGCAVAATGFLTGAATAAGPPPPTATNGHPVEQVAAGLGTPTSFAFGAGKVFEGDGGSQQPTVAGGVYLLSKGTATRLPGSPPVVFGLTWRKGTLYISAGSKILAWSGWKGSKFTKNKTIFKVKSKKFTGFQGLGFGADGRLYANVGLGNTNDHSPSTAPYAFDVVSMTAKGKHLKVVARGIRQPWQMVFPKGSSSPFVSDLGQDMGATNPPDFLLRVKPGQNYGFPKCNWTVPKACRKDAKPFKLFSPHTNVMGLGIIGKRLYMSEFGNPPGVPVTVVSMPLKGGTPTPLLEGFVAPIVGLGTHAGWVYVGELTGQVFRVKP